MVLISSFSKFIDLKASDLAKSLGYSDDDIKTIDSSWIQRFRKRHQICLKIQSGESASVT